MLTDNWPVDFTYISRRIVREIVQQHEAARSRRSHKIGLTGSIALGPFSPGLSLESAGRPVDYDNYFDLAKRATDAVSDHTGWLDRDKPDRVPTGPYVRAKFHMQVQKVPLPITVWERAYNHPIAIFVGVETVPGIGRVFIGLAGSASNFLHVSNGPSTATRTPSDAIGIYDIIQQSRELTDNGALEPGISAANLAQEFKYCPDKESRFREAIALFNGCGLSEPSVPLEMLIRIHHHHTDIDPELYAAGSRMGPFSQLILGAPVWISSCESSRDELVLQPRSRSRQSSKAFEDDFWRLQINSENFNGISRSAARSAEDSQERSFWHGMASPILHDELAAKKTMNWAAFDSQLSAYIETISQARPDAGFISEINFIKWPPEKSHWREFGEWFAAIAVRLGPDPIPFKVPQITSLSPLQKIRLVQIRRSPLRYGWFIKSAPQPLSSFPDFDRFNVIVLMDGTVWTGFDRRSHRNMGEIRQVALSAEEREAAATSIFWTIARWRTLMTKDGRVPRIRIVAKK